MSFIANALWRSDSGSQAEGNTPSTNPPPSGRPNSSAPPLASPCLGVNRKAPRGRTSLSPGDLRLTGWPSRGGLIVLEDPTPPDFEFLGLDPLDPPLQRDEDQEAEDAFCRGLLRLGATWWDSKERRLLVWKVAHDDEEACDAVEAGEQPLPTRRERRWVRVAWPSDPPGSLWVAERGAPIMGFDELPFMPTDAGRVALARNMDERCAVLKRLGGTWYASIDDYDGDGFLKAWEEGKQEGEVGPLAETSYLG
ncbi:MAG: hypothetical protein M4579_004947 [Chaenotheca gracillima]|nr:MAG: hypothetical protein M4579_004947 [Chaenotheca gracillima]